MSSANIRVVGIDPSPSKDSYVFDPDNVLGLNTDTARPMVNVPVEELIRRVRKLRKPTNRRVLVCWDAPLTGYVFPEEENVAHDFTSGSLYTRPIEKKSSEELPAGISVLGYAGAPHWTVSMAALELPRVLPMTRYSSVLPPPLCHISEQCANTPVKDLIVGPSVVEVHPALAAYHWINGPTWNLPSWNYKKNRGATSIENLTPEGFYYLLKRCHPAISDEYDLPGTLSSYRNANSRHRASTALTDGEFDAFVAWLLGRVWVDGGEVSLVGNAERGSWLMPQ